MKVILLAFSLILPSLQGRPVSKMTNSQRDGFVGPVKKVFEEWSPVTMPSSVATGTRCRRQTRTYDSDGRLTLEVDYPGVCGSEEIARRFTYDRGGNRLEEFDDSRASSIGPSPPQPPSGGKDEPQLFKHVFRYDDRARQVTESVYSPSGSLSYVQTDVYDDQGRLLEWRSAHGSNMQGRVTFAYDGLGPVPLSKTNFGSGEKPYSVNYYTEYDLNPRGDWIRCKETYEPAKGSKSVIMLYRTIEYY